jgi:NADPH:quinone reductase
LAPLDRSVGRGADRPGDTSLLHAVGGGVDLMATQLTVPAGARVIGTVGTRGKEKRALEFGAAKVINRDEEDFVATTLAFTGDGGVDKIVDSTGASILDRGFAAIRKLGHVVSYGEAEGRPLANLWERLVAKSLTFTRFHLGHVDFQSEIWRRSVEETTSAVFAGRLKTPIEDVFAFERTEAMLQRLAPGRSQANCCWRSSRGKRRRPNNSPQRHEGSHKDAKGSLVLKR